MTIKPFAIQGADLTLGGVSLQAGTTGVVIPGVTRATNYKVDEVNDTGDQTSTVEGTVAVLDAVQFAALSANGNADISGYATYIVELDDEFYIDNIEVDSAGTYTQQEATTNAGSDMWVPGVSGDVFASFNPADWFQVPFRPRMRAGTVELEGGGGGSGSGLVERTVNFPYGESGDTAGTLALTPGDEVYVCIADYVEPNSEPVEYDVVTSEGYNLTQSGDPGTLMSVVIARGDYPEIDTIMDTLGFQATGWQVTGNTTDGYTRDCIAEAGSGNRWFFTWEYVGGQDNSSYSQGEEFTLIYTAQQSIDVIWKRLSTGTANFVSFQNAGSIYQETDDAPGRYNIVINAEKDVVFNTDEGGNTFSLTSSGTLKFPDGSEQSTAAVGGGVTVTTDLWVAGGNSPGGAAVVSSTNGIDWTTSDYMLDGLTIEKVAISTDRIVYIVAGLPNGASSGLYHTDAPENVPVLASGTDFYGPGFPLNWRELNYLGGKFVAVGSYTISQTIATGITSLTLAAGDRTASQLTITNTAWDYNGQLITISGATNTELNGTWRLSYNNLDTLGSGVYDILTQDWQTPTFTSTDITGAVIADFSGDCTFPIYAYSTDGVAWTYGTIDGEYIMMVIGETPQSAMADVAYNGTGYLIPVVKNTFYTDNPYVEGYGAFYITDLAGGANGPQFIPGSGPNSLPGMFNNIAAYADGTFFVSDDAYTVWTNANPTTDPWVEHNIQSALTNHLGFDVGSGIGQYGAEIYDSVAGTVGGQEMFVTTAGEGTVVWTTDNGTTWNVVTVAPFVQSVPLDTQGASTSLDFNAIETPRNWEKITIQVTGNDDVRWNGTYYAYNNTPDNIYKLYDGVEGNAIDSSAWTAPTNSFTVTLTHGADLSKLHVADDTCIVYSNNTPNKLYRSTNMTTWTEVFTNDAYYVNDIYYATRTATASNRLDYTDEETGYNSTAVLTYDFKVDVDNAHLDINGDGSWEIGSTNFDTKIYAAGLEEPTNIVVQANNRYWTFDDAGGFRFPDDTVQTTAFVNRNINLDGGGAAVHYEQEIGFVDGGFSATRHGVADPVFDGGNRLTSDNQFNINGGGA